MSTLSPTRPRGSLGQTLLPAGNAKPVEWEISDGLIPYPEAIERMEVLAADIHAGHAPERVWLLEHPPLYTAGTRAREQDLVAPGRFPVYRSGRGGEYTYHGPGQRICYVMLDLKRRKPDVRLLVSALESWIISTLGQFNVTGERREDRVGVWVKRPDKPVTASGSLAEDKIAAIGIRLKRWVSFHGISINLEPDLEHYSGIIPCGVREHGVTSLVDLGLPVTMNDLDLALKQEFTPIFGPVSQTR